MVCVGASVFYYSEYYTWQEGHGNAANAKIGFPMLLGTPYIASPAQLLEISHTVDGLIGRRHTSGC